jgi:hypothetical protein
MDLPPVPVAGLQAFWFALLLGGQVTLVVLIFTILTNKSKMKNESSILNVLLIVLLLAITYSML